MCACATPYVFHSPRFDRSPIPRPFVHACGARVSYVRECEPQWIASPTPVKAPMLVLKL